MVILVIYNRGLSVLESERETPVPGYFHGPMIFELSQEFVQPRPGVIHILYLCGRIKTVKNIQKLLRMGLLHSPAVAVVKEVSSPLWAKLFIMRRDVTFRVTCVNGRQERKAS